MEVTQWRSLRSLQPFLSVIYFILSGVKLPHPGRVLSGRVKSGFGWRSTSSAALKAVSVFGSFSPEGSYQGVPSGTPHMFFKQQSQIVNRK